MILVQKWKRIKCEKKSFIKVILFNCGFTVFLYVYYIGYSLQSLKSALFRVSPNAVYFSIISIGVGILTVGILLVRDNLKRGGSLMINYHLTRIDRIIGSIVFILAFLLRIAGFNWGAGVTFHPDEGNVVRTPIAMAANNTLMSDDLFYPSQVTSKVLCVLYEILEIVGGIFKFEVTTLMQVYTARIYVALLSAGAVVCIFLIGNHFKRHAGTIAALLAAVFPPFVYAAHCVIGDNFVTLCVGLIILCALHYLEKEQEYLWLIAMSIVAAMATLDKYHGMILCTLIATVVCVKQIKKGTYRNIILQGCVAIGAVLVTIVVIAPNLIINLSETIKSVLFFIQNDAYDEGATFISNLSAYTMWFFSNIGILSIIAVGVGVYSIVKECKIKLAALSIGLIELLAMCLQTRHYIRWGLPFYLVLFVFAGIGIVAFYEKITCNNKKWIQVLGSIGVLIIWLNGFTNTMLLDLIYLNSNLDTRIVSEVWCSQNEIREEECIYDDYTCWRPGGMVQRADYAWRNSISVAASVVEENGQIWIKHLGRNYAVAKLGTAERGELDNYNNVKKVAFFKSENVNDGAFLEDYQDFSDKIFEPCSIIDALKKSFDILSKKIYIGNNIAIYDISNVPAYEEHNVDSFEVVEDEQYNVYGRVIESISAGQYQIDVRGLMAGQVVLENANGELMERLNLINGKGTIILSKNYHNIFLKIVCEEGQKAFESIRIETLIGS